MATEGTVNIGTPVQKTAPSAPEATSSGNDGACEWITPSPATLPLRALGDALSGPRALPRVPGYEVVGEIARGGMGMVLAARDPVLGRAVAIKVLLPGNRSVEAARRFVQESKITARLPHPGIPPVYALGRLADGTPFLAMKLVGGNTLAAELRRDERTSTLPRLVPIFEQVAQAVGFAHSQGVIHRDLKPTNVMVGAFGEVQVMDWGIAKETEAMEEDGSRAEAPSPVRRTAEDPLRTELGLALGTPAYMAPEQARGEAIGPTADVFSLGGILCDILTGHPPFEADTVHDTIRRAALGDVAPAYVHLDACAADEQLVSLCKRLLSPRAEDRPRDGKAVADALAAYRIGVEMRLRAAETERVAAEARAVERRKKRRAQIALAASIAIFAGALGLGAWWQDRQSSARRLADERRQETEDRRAARNAMAFDELLAECEVRLRSGDADRAAEALGQAGERFAEGAADDAGDRLGRFRTELELLREIDRIDGLEWAVVRGERPNRERLISLWSGLFERLGFAAGSPPTAETAKRIAGSAIRESLLATLEKWFWAQPSQELFELLVSVDPDDYRNDLRAGKRTGNSARVARRAGDAEALDQPARFAIPLARDPMVPEVRRERILQISHRRRPNHFAVLMDLATVRPDESRERTAERAGWYRAAIAVQPRSVAAWSNLGNALNALGSYPAAIAACREAIRIDPLFAAAHSNLGSALREAKDFPAALAAFREAVRLDPESAPGQNNLANGLQDQGDLPGAIAAFKEAIRLRPDFAVAWANLASALCEAGDPKGAVAACREAIRHEPTYALAHYHLGNSLREAGDLPGAIAAYRDTIRLDPNYGPVHSNLGTALRERGDLPGAIAAYRESIRLKPDFAQAHSYLGNALRETGDLPASTVACREAIRLDPKLPHAHHHLGLVLRAAGKLPDAIAAYREAIRLDPNSARYRNSSGLALKATGDSTGAMAAFREAIRIDPKHTPALNNLGLILAASGELDSAIAAYRDAIRIDPKDFTANYNLGLALTAKEDTRGAIAAYREAIRLKPKLVFAHANLATLLRDSGDRPGAMESYRAVIGLNPQHAGTHAALGLALLESGEAEAGKKAFAEAARLDPKQFGPLYREKFPEK